MKKIDLYIYKKFIGTFFFAIAMLVPIVICFDLAENIDNFIDHHAPWQRVVVDYYLMSIPYFINLFIHLFVFVSVIFFTSKMASRTEIVAILSSGISFWRLLVPYLMAALTIAVMSLYFGNFLIPKTSEIRRHFQDKYIERLSQSAGLNLHVRIAEDEFVYVERYSASRQFGPMFSWEKYDGNKLIHKVTGEMLYHDTLGENSWNIDQYVIRTINDTTENLEMGNNYHTALNLYPKDLINMKKDFEEMDYFELRDHIREMHEKGSVVVKEYEVEMQRRMADPVAIIILTLIGVALSSRKINSGLGGHLGLGIIIAIFYIFFMEVFESYGLYDIMSPFMAVWIPNFIFMAIGIYLLIKAPK